MERFKPQIQSDRGGHVYWKLIYHPLGFLADRSGNRTFKKIWLTYHSHRFVPAWSPVSKRWKRAWRGIAPVIIIRTITSSLFIKQNNTCQMWIRHTLSLPAPPDWNAANAAASCCRSLFKSSFPPGFNTPLSLELCLAPFNSAHFCRLFCIDFTCDFGSSTLRSGWYFFYKYLWFNKNSKLFKFCWPCNLIYVFFLCSALF